MADTVIIYRISDSGYKKENLPSGVFRVTYHRRTVGQNAKLIGSFLKNKLPKNGSSKNIKLHLTSGLRRSSWDHYSQITLDDFNKTKIVYLFQNSTKCKR